jgi:hypothetical protein
MNEKGKHDLFELTKLPFDLGVSDDKEHDRSAEIAAEIMKKKTHEKAAGAKAVEIADAMEKKKELEKAVATIAAEINAAKEKKAEHEKAVVAIERKIEQEKLNAEAGKKAELEKATAAIKKKINQINGEINNVSDKAVYIAQRDFLEAMFTDSKKTTLNTAKYEQLKKEKTNEVIETFKETVKKMKKQTVTEQYVQSFSKRVQLSEKNVRKVLESFGFEIIKFTVKLPEFPERTRMREIERELDNLRRFANGKPQYAELAVVRDMYDLAEYILKSPCRNADYTKLRGLFTKFASAYPGHQPSPTDICARVSTTASAMLFNTKENKDRYDNYLLYNAPEMVRLRESIKMLPEYELRTPDVADSLIAEIERFFPDKEQSISIYNDIAGFNAEGVLPYIQQAVKPPVPEIGTLMSFGGRRKLVL